MEWIGLFLWLVVAALALPLGRHGHSPPYALGLQAMAAVGGLCLCIVFLALGHRPALAWGATGLGVVGTVSVVAAVAWLISESRPLSHAGQGAEETSAALAGVVLPLFALATGTAALMAFEVGMVS